MKKIKILVKIIIFLLIYIGAQKLVTFLILDDTNTISRIMLHDMYSEEENIDILFCGASHCQLGINPWIMDKAFGKNTYNVGSSSQGLETSLALIKEVAAHNDLEQVYVDLDYSIVMRDIPNLESIYIISDYMRPSIRKISFLLNATSFDYYFNSFMPLHKGRGYISGPKDVVEIVSKKLDRGYWNYENIDPSYGGKGYIASKTIVSQGDPIFTDVYENITGDIPGTSIENINAMIDFCNKNGISITFINIPTTEYRASRMNSYDDYIDAIKKILAPSGTEYYDFNLYRPEALPLNDLKYYNDDNHLNVNGSTLFGNMFASFMQGNISEDDLLYASFNDKWGK